MIKGYQDSGEGVKPLSEADLDNLQWALDFMKRYEKKHESVKR